MVERTLLRAMMVSLVSLAAGCASGHTPGPADPSHAPPPGLPLETVRLHGSFTLGEALAPELAKAYFEEQKATDVQIDDQHEKHHFVIQGTLPEKRLAIEIESLGSSTAFEDLAAGKCEIGMSARPIHDDEAAQLKALGDFTSYQSENVIALGGIAVIVNKANPVKQLSFAQLESIFTGKTTNWSGVSGVPGPIHVFAGVKTSGTADIFSSNVLDGKEPSAPGATFAMHTGISDGVAADPNAIGYVEAGEMKSTKAVAVVNGGAEPLLPTAVNVTTEDYPLSRRHFFYLRNMPATSAARAFVEFALSEEGQAVAERLGFFSMLVRPVSQPSAPHHSTQYVKFTAGAQRLPLDFRFRGSPTALDSKAHRDLDRVADFVKRGARLEALLGFSDDSGGDEAANVALSKEQAQVVASELEKRGVSAKEVAGLGSVQPIASNRTKQGREQNRRVEIWVRSFLRNNG